MFFKSDAPAGANLYGCAATNTWSLQGGASDMGSNGIGYRMGPGTWTPASADKMSGPSFCQDGGTTSAYACNLTPAITAYTAGTTYWFRANTANGGAATINFNSLGPKAIVKQVNQTLAGNDIKAGQWVMVTFDGVSMQMQSQTGNASAGSGSNLTVKSDGVTVGSRGTANYVTGTGLTTVVTDTGTQINIQTALDTAVVQTQQGEQTGTALLCISNSGSTTAYQCFLSPTAAAYTTGMVLRWKPDVNGAGGPTTLNVDTLGAKAVKLADGVSDPSASDLPAGRLNQIWYDGTAFRLLSGGGTVASVFGRTGPVTGQTGDYSAGLITGLAPSATTDTTNAANITSGLLSAARLPPTIMSNTTGNAQTATALGATPSKCSPGNYPSGIDAQGNAQDCAPSGSGGAPGVGRASLSATWTAIPDDTCQEQTATWSGIGTADTVTMGAPPGLPAGLIANLRVSAPNTVAIRLCNQSGAPVTPGPQTFEGVLAVNGVSGTATLDFATIPDGACASNVFTLTGVAPGDALTPKWPTSLDPGLIGHMVGTATNTVQVELCNFSGAAVDPAGQSFGASIGGATTDPTKILTTAINQPNGVAGLDSNGVVTGLEPLCSPTLTANCIPNADSLGSVGVGTTLPAGSPTNSLGLGGYGIGGSFAVDGVSPQYMYGYSCFLPGGCANTLGGWVSGIDQVNTPNPRDFVPVAKVYGFAVNDAILTSGSSVLTSVQANFNSLAMAMPITGTGVPVVGAGIPAGTIITSVTDSSHAVMSANATASGNPVTVKFVSSAVNDRFYWRHNGFGNPTANMENTPLYLSEIMNGGWGFSGTNSSNLGSCSVGGTDLAVDATNPLKVTGATLNGNDYGGWIDIAAGTGWKAGRYYIISSASGYAILQFSPAAAGTTGGHYRTNLGRIALIDSTPTTFYACLSKTTATGGAQSGAWVDISSPVYHRQVAAAQAVFYGWEPAGVSDYNGAVQLGINPTESGLLHYDDGGNTTLYLDSKYNNAAAKMKLRLRTAGTPVDALTLNGDGTAWLKPPTSCTGVPTGMIWNNAGALAICP